MIFGATSPLRTAHVPKALSSGSVCGNVTRRLAAKTPNDHFRPAQGAIRGAFPGSRARSVIERSPGCDEVEVPDSAALGTLKPQAPDVQVLFLSVPRPQICDQSSPIVGRRAYAASRCPVDGVPLERWPSCHKLIDGSKASLIDCRYERAGQRFHADRRADKHATAGLLRPSRMRIGCARAC